MLRRVGVLDRLAWVLSLDDGYLRILRIGMLWRTLVLVWLHL